MTPEKPPGRGATSPWQSCDQNKRGSASPTIEFFLNVFVFFKCYIVVHVLLVLLRRFFFSATKKTPRDFENPLLFFGPVFFWAPWDLQSPAWKRKIRKM